MVFRACRCTRDRIQGMLTITTTVKEMVVGIMDRLQTMITTINTMYMNRTNITLIKITATVSSQRIEIIVMNLRERRVNLTEEEIITPTKEMNDPITVKVANKTMSEVATVMQTRTNVTGKRE